MKTWKQYLPDLLAVILFAVLAFAYFFPADTEGRILYQHDSSAGRGAGVELNEYHQRTGEVSRWTNALFSGMPTYQMSPAYKSVDALTQVTDAYHLWLPNYVWYIFVYLLGFYILLRAFDFRQLMASLGAVIWTFSSYFLIIIAAGHYWKVMALAYLPPMIAGVILAYRGKYLKGLLVTAIFSAFEVYANHVQMTYYFLFVIICMIIAFLVDAIRKHQMAHFWKATAACAVGAIIGISLNISNLYHTWEYGQETMRGKSELVKKNTSNQTSSGLDRDYITQWSYGVDETWTLLIPNAKGGSNQIQLGKNEKAMEKCDPQYAEVVSQWYQYWGDQPFTAGPVYAGAFVLMLFILGLFIVKGPMKWALLAATLLSIFLSWGKNFMPFTNFFIDYIPMYAKFRTVSSILVIAEFTIPLLAMLTLKKIVDEPEILTQKIKYVYTSFGLTAGFALIFALVPTMFFDFTSASDSAQLSHYVPQQYLAPILENIAKVREPIFTSDCWRTVIIIVIGTLMLLLFKAKKLKTEWMVGGILVLCLIDMWQVDKRYLYDDMFVESSVKDQPVPKSRAIEQIIQDKALDYRVLNFASDTFNENETSYYVKSIGGYHPAKLRRYQELIDNHIVPEMQATSKAVINAQGDMTKVNGDSVCPVLNMLNTKYFIFGVQNNQTVPIQNPYTYGNAWFVDKIQYVDNANEEIDALSKLPLRHVAVADKKFKDVLGQSTVQDTESIVKITAYEPNKLNYDVKSGKGGIIVFSEIYYPGWTAKVDGQDVEIGRVNYVLRAIQVKPGNHKVELSFNPKSVTTTETIAYVAYAVLIILILFIVYMEVKKRKQQE